VKHLFLYIYNLLLEHVNFKNIVNKIYLNQCTLFIVQIELYGFFKILQKLVDGVNWLPKNVSNSFGIRKNNGEFWSMRF